ncbi:hypothetical protein DFH09DRAFT_1244549 [Mycena vulgaris]|nr:hypothetical protein DFH09DRAFT_1244549 [Mycena vulgaris]
MASRHPDGTIEVYGSGLLSYHVFCDSKHIPERQRALASPPLIAAYLFTLAGVYAGGTVSNYMSSIRAWHVLPGVAWNMNDDKIKGLLKAADLHPHFNLANALDASCWSCLTTLFYSTSRGGKFTTKNLKSFDPTTNITCSAVTVATDRNSLRQTNFKLPRTKSSLHGEDVYWARQHGPTDPEAALANHFMIKDPPPDAFTTCLTAAFKAAKLDWLQVHGIHIGSTLEYLLRGIPLEVMKSKEHWASDSFSLYLRNHAEIMAPYMQADPQLHQDVLRIVMPRVR